MRKKNKIETPTPIPESILLKAQAYDLTHNIEVMTKKRNALNKRILELTLAEENNAKPITGSDAVDDSTAGASGSAEQET